MLLSSNKIYLSCLGFCLKYGKERFHFIYHFRAFFLPKYFHLPWNPKIISSFNRSFLSSQTFFTFYFERKSQILGLDSNMHQKRPELFELLTCYKWIYKTCEDAGPSIHSTDPFMESRAVIKNNNWQIFLPSLWDIHKNFELFLLSFC